MYLLTTVKCWNKHFGKNSTEVYISKGNKYWLLLYLYLSLQ